MSTVKVNELSTYSGTDISIETGKTVAGTASQFKMTDVVQGDVLYGSADDTLSRLAPGTSGDHLQSGGAGANPSWVAPPAGGLTTASQWRLTTDFANTAAPIASNLEEADAPVGFGVLGSSMTQASGIFTFPSTGYWYVTFTGSFQFVANENNAVVQLQTTTDSPTNTWGTAAAAGQYMFNYASGTIYAGASTSYIFDVTSVSTHKVRFVISVATATTITRGATGTNRTFMTFLRLADT